MADTPNLDALLAKIPELDKRKDKNGAVLKDKDGKDQIDGRFTGPSWEQMKQILDPLLAGGRPALEALVAKVNAVDDGTDYRVRYTIHAAGLYTHAPEKKAERAALVAALVGALGKAPKGAQLFCIYEWQAFGEAGVVPALGKLLLDDELGDPAAAAITAIRTGAVEQFRSMLSGATGRRRLTILQALAVLQDAGSVAAFKDALADKDVDIRLTAASALANLGDVESAEALLKVADAQGWERIKATQACLVLAEKASAAGKKDCAKRIYTHLQKTRTEASEKYVQDLATKALAAL